MSKLCFAMPGNKPGYVWPLQAARFARIPGPPPQKTKSGFLGTPRLSPPAKSVGERLTGAVHRTPFPIAALCFEAAPQPLRALAPADILFRTLHLACLAGLSSFTTDCIVISTNLELKLIQARVRSCRYGQQWRRKPLKVKLLSPGEQTSAALIDYVSK